MPWNIAALRGISNALRRPLDALGSETPMAREVFCPRSCLSPDDASVSLPFWPGRPHGMGNTFTKLLQLLYGAHSLNGLIYFQPAGRAAFVPGLTAPASGAGETILLWEKMMPKAATAALSFLISASMVSAGPLN